jgi:formylglycine-generating enzyme required for sulfatase activity
MIFVSWDDAAAYCKWVGGRLPTEAEWEKAARMGSVGKKYPLGDRISHKGANYKGTDDKDLWEYCAPVGSFAPSDYSLHDMAGNVWEWCSDWYNRDYYSESPSHNPQGPSSGSLRVLRGGSWYFSTYLLRAAYRFNSIPTDLYGDYGFRVVSQD